MPGVGEQAFVNSAVCGDERDRVEGVENKFLGIPP